ncbi:MAG: hypothetical protein RE471_07940 [Ferroplasma sp.]|uniref:hypothetical protein n=1 Tax=Ferroplasma sp. TaxID=2591003 RepID=UPI00281513C4|nr:hypothetical protein [Ferroplasma sp.]WMT50897.1 MAG: hypothetical protein RE471_07940 [Ferroplasma sp.]
MAKKVLIIILSGERDKGKAIMALNLANHLGPDTRVIFFGESEKLAASGDSEISNLVTQLQERGIIPVACINYAEKSGIGTKLMELKYDLKPVSTVITDYLEQGYVPITF